MLVLVICSAEYMVVCLNQDLMTFCARIWAESGANVEKRWKITAGASACEILREYLRLCSEDGF